MRRIWRDQGQGGDRDWDRWYWSWRLAFPDPIWWAPAPASAFCCYVLVENILWRITGSSETEGLCLKANNYKKVIFARATQVYNHKTEFDLNLLKKMKKNENEKL